MVTLGSSFSKTNLDSQHKTWKKGREKSSLHFKYGSRYWSGRVGLRSFSPIFSARRCISFVPQSTAPHVQRRATTLQMFQFSTSFVLFVGADLSNRLSADELTISASTKRWLHTPFASIPSRFFLLRVTFCNCSRRGMTSTNWAKKCLITTQRFFQYPLLDSALQEH